MLVSVQVNESTSTQLRVERLYDLVRLVELYNTQLGAMTVGELKSHGYKASRGKGHVSLVRSYLINQL
ncbi:MAG: hypothetical protein M1815_002201 [Lichina confinis]|nr:MAG: hypothetical protein M1815_002201 [Lichina confinis]